LEAHRIPVFRRYWAGGDFMSVSMGSHNPSGVDFYVPAEHYQTALELVQADGFSTDLPEFPQGETERNIVVHENWLTKVRDDRTRQRFWILVFMIPAAITSLIVTIIQLTR